MKNPKYAGIFRFKTGFTLVELMLVVSILALLVGIATPKFIDLVRKSQEAVTKGNLTTLKSTLSIYYSSNEGSFPIDDLTSLIPNYISKIPPAKLPPFHPDSDAVLAKINPITGIVSAIDDGGGWFYNSDSSDNDWGTISANCIHTDSKGVMWNTY